MIYVVNSGTTLSAAQINALDSLVALGTTAAGSAITKDAGGNFVNTVISSGSGTVNSGTQYRLAYYATTGTSVSEAGAITASRALVSDANGVPTHSATTATELGYVSGVTSAIQTQLGAKIGALGAIGSTPNANGATISGSTLNLEPADATFGGIVTAGTQSFAGAKTFTSSTTINGGLSIGGAGAFSSASAGMQLVGSTTLVYTSGVSTSTTSTLTTGVSSARFIIGAGTVGTFTSGTHPIVASAAFSPQTITNNGATVTNTATVYIGSAMTGGTNNYGLWVDSGTVRIDDTIELGAATDTTLSRLSAGVLAVEGVRVITDSSTTSGKILKNNGTTFVASTETYAAPGTSGNVMTSDGTNWTSATPSSGGPTMRIDGYFETSGRYDVTSGGTGGVAIGGNYGARVTSLATANSYAEVQAKMSIGTNFEIFNGSPKASTVINLTSCGPSANTGQGYWGIGNLTVSGTSITFTGNHIGFKFLTTGSSQYSLYATQAGGTETASSALTTFTANDVLGLYFKVNGTSSVDYYWQKNGGAWSSATNLTTNMPTSTTVNEIMQWAVNNQNTANTNRFEVSGFSYER